MSEADKMRGLQKLATKLGARLFRRNVGVGWVGVVVKVTKPMTVKVDKGDVVLRNARPFHSATAGMSDLSGWSPVVVKPDMVGKTIAVVAEVEVKDGTDTTPEQRAWITAVRNAGGFAGVARDDDDLTKILRGELVD